MVTTKKNMVDGKEQIHFASFIILQDGYAETYVEADNLWVLKMTFKMKINEDKEDNTVSIIPEGKDVIVELINWNNALGTAGNTHQLLATTKDGRDIYMNMFHLKAGVSNRLDIQILREVSNG